MKITVSIVLFFGFGWINLYAQQLVYKPINPSFGGDTFNYQWLLSSADAQNPYKNNSYPDFKPTTAIGSFEDTLNRQLLNQISRGLFGSDYENAQMEPGVYNLGTMNIKITEYFGGVNIHIIDIKTGEQTNINLPNT